MITELDVEKLRGHLKSQGIGPAELERRSGVSRAQLSRLLTRSKAGVRTRTLESIAGALRLDPVELVLGGKQQKYLDWVIEQTGFVDFRGLGLPQLQRLPIGEVFVEPSVRSEPEWPGRRGEPCNEGSGAGIARFGSLGSARPFPASKAILGDPRVVVLGEPGIGKTTLLCWLAHEAARGRAGGVALPLYLRLSELSRALKIDLNADPVRLVAGLASDAGCPDVEGLLSRELASGRCLILLDGLDEAVEESRRGQLMEAVRAFVERYAGNRFVVASRPFGFEKRPWRSLGFSVVRVLRYGPAEIEKFIDKWSHILPRIFGRTRSQSRDSLQEAIFSNPRVRGLASNPLALTILTLLNESRGGTLPRRRVDLYARVADVFLDTWERTRRPSRTFDETSDIDLDAREFCWLLSCLALSMQKGGRTLAPRWWIADRFQETLQGKLGFSIDQAKSAGDRILRYLTERTGLIREEGRDHFSFWHRTLQEYFAAMGIIDEADASRSRDVTDSLRSCFFDPGWCEVVRLASAKLTPAAAESMLRSILDDADPVGRFLRRGPLLALRCLSDGATVPDRGLVAGIFESFGDLGSSKWIGITLEALGVLEAFQGTRWEELAKKTIETILDAGRTGLDPQEYRCLHEYVHRSVILEEVEHRQASWPQTKPAWEVTLDVSGLSNQFVIVNTALSSKSPEEWTKSACSVLDDASRSDPLKSVLEFEIACQCTVDPRSRKAVTRLLDSGALPRRSAEACIRALSFAARDKDTDLLRRFLERDDVAVDVRAACASGLERVAVTDRSVRERLRRILESEGDPGLREGAARGLSRAAATDPDAAAILLRLARREETAPGLRSACAWALEGSLGKTPEVANTFLEWVESPVHSELRRIAAQVLANAMAFDEVPWSSQAAERIERVLMNLEDPCPHALQSLQALAVARETRHALKLEGVLRETLKPFKDRIRLAFVFGSTARRKQGPGSDIDLMVIGDVTLKDVSTPLREAERTLGRRINPALYSREAFRERYQAGDPFLIDVYRREKIAIIPGKSAAAEKELEHDLGGMVADRVLASRT